MSSEEEQEINSSSDDENYSSEEEEDSSNNFTKNVIKSMLAAAIHENNSPTMEALMKSIDYFFDLVGQVDFCEKINSKDLLLLQEFMIFKEKMRKKYDI